VVNRERFCIRRSHRNVIKIYDDSSNNDEGDVESGIKYDTEEDTKPSSSKGETLGTPRTDTDRY